MNTLSQKADENKSRESAEGYTRTTDEGIATYQLSDNHPRIIAQRSLGETLNSNPKIHAQIQLERELNQSPRVQSLMQMRQALNSGPHAVAQAKATQSQEGSHRGGEKAGLNSLTSSTVVQRLKIEGEEESIDLSSLDLDELLEIHRNLEDKEESFTVGRTNYVAEEGDVERVQEEIRRKKLESKSEMEVEEEEPARLTRKRKRGGKEKEQLSEQESVIDEELMEWLKSEPTETSGYWTNKKIGPKKVRKISKGDQKDLACWNWALRALSEEGGPSPGDFWNYIHAIDEKPGWLEEIPELVKGEIKNVTSELARSKLKINLLANKPPKYSQKQRGEAKNILTNASRLLVQSHGFEIAEEGEEAGWVVCQYIYSEGAAVPEHWWIELPGDVVIQTVPDIDYLEVGGPEIRWHSEEGREEEDAPEYGTIRIPVKALKGRHVEILKAGMKAAMEKQTETKRPSKRAKTSTARRGRGGRGGRGR